ncbi:TetR/AcrR family transcriptional regulator [Cumulibacter manganitolerans]|uniref:TetR/AcrR family transcriptional regulator n=1 Tax=Cumulibacter manganitolerans TaxID=1884992 RepID=UPI0012977DE8|nr:TetR/AcrR family transcriptional regulator [Cumulibacter manganitolerans]
MVRLAINERRELLIDAAWRVMMRSGVAAATTRAICAEAGMPQSSFHYCFDSRADLLKIVVTRRVPMHIGLARQAMDGAPSIEDLVHGSLAAYWNDVTAHPEVHAAMFDITLTSHYDPDLEELRHFQYEEYHRAALAILQMATQDGRYRWDLDIEPLAVGLIAVLDGVTLRYCVDPQTRGLQQTLREYGRYLVSHLKATEPEAPEPV